MADTGRSSNIGSMVGGSSRTVGRSRKDATSKGLSSSKARTSRSSVTRGRHGTRQSRSSHMAGRRHKGGDGGGGSEELRVYVEGQDVTPKQLQQHKPSGGALPAAMTSGQTTPTSQSEMSENMERISSAGFSRSAYSMGSDDDAASDAGSVSSTPRGKDEVDADAEGKDSRRVGNPFELEELPLTEADLEAPTYITLEETETFTLLSFTAKCVQAETEEAEAVEASNARYQAVLDARAGSETFVEGGMQTLITLRKNKEIQQSAPPTVAQASQANLWDIYDETEEGNAGEEAIAEGDVVPAAAEKKKRGAGLNGSIAPGSTGAGGASQSMAGASMAAGGTGSMSMGVTDAGATEGAAAGGEGGGGEGAAAADTVGVQSSRNLMDFGGMIGALSAMERALMQNTYHDKLLLYRNFRPREDAPPEYKIREEEGSQDMRYLWEFQCALTEGRNVSCMAFNNEQKDMLAVGYGQFEFSQQTEGMVAFWSLKNPEYPAWTFSSPSGVTALSFSTSSPEILAVGFYNGMVAIYDVRQPTEKPTPIMESGHTSGKHSDPVWKLRWVPAGPDRGEALVSISTDGRITQWTIKKGLEFQDLIKLKRVANRRLPPQKKDGESGGVAVKTEAFISRRSSGLCFDFSPRDPSIYIAGTEDGLIHKCSCSYSEQYLTSYPGHGGPVYQVQWSPFKHDLFLSASADWTVKLWSDESEQALLTFQSGNDKVADLQWSPTSSTVFSTVSTDGRVEVWDLSQSTLKPVLAHTLESHKLSTVLFSVASPILVAGSHNGAVSVFRLVGVEKPESNPAEQLAVLEEAMAANIISNKRGN